MKNMPAHLKHLLATAIALPATLLLCSNPLYGANNSPAPAGSPAASALGTSTAREALPRTETIGLCDPGIYWHIPNIEKALNLSKDQVEALWSLKEYTWGKYEVGKKYRALKQAQRGSSEQDGDAKAARIAWGNAANAAEKEFREQAPSKLNPEQAAVLNKSPEWLLYVKKQAGMEMKFSMPEIEGETGTQRWGRARKIAGLLIISDLLNPEQTARAGLGSEAERARVIEDLREGRKTEK